MKSELAIKRDEWLASVEGSHCLDGGILVREEGRKILRNRIEAAFLAGAIANEEVKREFCEKVLDAIEPLGGEFQKVLDDNLPELYEN